ncbi:MAG: hypothetical protein BRC41_00930 [Cyanobacteria bacterium QH_9_48_43]|nr:MAG: hypothetical protein BRC41_00930 [Cyanobacteria bacterium QH_9_48_43]
MTNPNHDPKLNQDELSDNTEAVSPDSAEQELLDWAQYSSDPEVQRLVEQARTGDEQPVARPLWKQALAGAWQKLTPRSQDFYGTAAVSPELRRDAKLTTSLVSLATWLNFLSTQPLLWFAFGALGPLRLVPSVGFNLLLLGLTNISATATAKAKPNNRSWSRWALMGLISINVIQSLLAGMGTELMLSRSKLQLRKAEELTEQVIAQRESEVERLEQAPQDSRFASVQQQCQKNTQKLDQLEHGSPQWDILYIRTFGTLEEKDKDWSQLDYSNLPVCQRVERLRQNHSDKVAARRQELQQFPGKYERNFTQDGELESGNELFGIAGLYFFENLVKGNFAQLGFSLFFFFLSLSTSLMAMGMSMDMAKRNDAQRSRSDAVASERDRWFDELRLQMKERHAREQREAQHPEASDEEDDRQT